MADDRRKKNLHMVYSTLKSEGYTDIGDEQDFEQKMQDEQNRKKVYEALRSSGYTDIGKDYDSFSGMIYAAPAKEAATESKPQQKGASTAKPTGSSTGPSTGPSSLTAASMPANGMGLMMADMTALNRKDASDAEQKGAAKVGPKAASKSQSAHDGNNGHGEDKWKDSMLGKAVAADEAENALPPVLKKDDNGELEQTVVFDGSGKPKAAYMDVYGKPHSAEDEKTKEAVGIHNELERHYQDKSMSAVEQNREQVSSMADDIDKQLAAAHDEISRRRVQRLEDAQEKGFWAGAWQNIKEAGTDSPADTHIPVRRSQNYGESDLSKEGEKLTSDVHNLEVAKSTLKEAQRTIDEADHNAQEGTFGKWLESSFAGGAVRGFGQKLFDPRTWDSGLSDAHDAAMLKTALDKADEGKELTRAEQTMLDAMAVKLATDAYFGSQVGRGYKAGQVTAESIPFMLEMCINPAAGAGHAAENKMVRYALKRFGKEAIKKGGEKYLKRQAMQVTGRVAGDLAGSMTMAATTGSARVAAGAMERMNGDILPDTDENGNTIYGGHTEGESLPTALGKSFADTSIENYSEMFGEYFKPVGEWAGKWAGKAAGKVYDKMPDKVQLGIDKVRDLIDNIQTSDAAKIVTDFEQQAKWNGVFGEYAEEVAGNVMNSIIVGDMTMDAAEGTGVFNLDQNIDTFLGVSLMGGFFSAMKTAGYRTPKYRAKQAMTAADDAASAAWADQDKWGAIRNTLAFGTEEDGKQALAGMMLDGSLTEEQKRAALAYAKTVETYRGMLQADAKRKKDNRKNDPVQEDAENSYDNGYDLDEPTDMNDAKNMMDFKRQQMEEKAPDVLELIDKAENPVEQTKIISETLDEEQKKLAVEYLNAKATYDGMIDRVRDDIEEQVNRSNAMVDERTNGGTGMIHPAVMKQDDRKVYVVDGELKPYDDGTGVDIQASSESILIRDAETGQLEWASPSEVLSIDEAIDPMEEKRKSEETVRFTYAAERANVIDGVLPFAKDDVYWVVDEDGAGWNVQILSDNGDGTVNVAWNGTSKDTVSKETLQGMSDRAALAKLEAFEAEKTAQEAEDKQKEQEVARPAYNLEDDITIYDEEGNAVRGTVTASENADGMIEVFTDQPVNGYRINLYTRDQLDEITKPKEKAAPIAPVQENGAQEAQAEGETEQPAAQPVEQPTGEVAGTAAAENPVVDENPVASTEGAAVPGSEVAAETAAATAAETTTAETEAPGEQATAVAEPMPMVGEGEDAEPDFAKATPTRAHDYIYKEAGLDEETAKVFVDNNLKAAQKEAEKLAKKKPKMGTSITKYNKETAEWQRQVDAAKATAEYWQQVAAEHDKVVAQRMEESRQRQTELTDKAIEEEKAYQAEQQRKAEEQAALGVNNVSPVIKEKWESAKKVDGARNEITIANGEKISGHYVLVESGAATASHDVNKGFAKSEGFPVDENGGSVNDRDYERDADAQRITREHSNQYDSRAVQNPVIVSGDGVVLSGNGRTMAGELAAAQNTDGAYIDYLKEYPAQFGFTREQVEGMEHPRVVFVPDAAMPYTAETFAKFNQQEMKGQSKTEQAVKLGKVVDDATFGRTTRTINQFDTLGDFYADKEATAAVISDLQKCGAISGVQLAEMWDGDVLSAAGKETIENLLIGKAFEKNPDAVRMATETKSMRQSIITALAEISNNVALENGFSLEEELAAAIDLVYQARKNGGIKAGERVSGYARQLNLFPFEEGETVADYKNAAVLMLADVLNDNRTTLLKKTLATYNGRAKEAASGQMDMFTGKVPTKEEIINEVKSLLNYGTEEKQDKRKATDAKRGTGNEQTGSAGSGSEGSEANIPGEGADRVPEVYVGLSEDEANELLSRMEAEAVEIPQIELNPDNWLEQFGEDGMVSTPIAKVKMGENQIAKLFEKGRSEQFGMIKPTLEHPQAIIEVPSEATDGNTERASSLLFVKTFKKADGTKVYYFKSVTVKKDGLEVSVSSHYDRAKRVKEALKEGKLLYRFDGGAQTERHPADVSVTTSPESSQGNISVETSEPTNSRTDVDSNLDGKSDDTATRQSPDVSDSKVTKTSGTKQEKSEKSSEKYEKLSEIEDRWAENKGKEPVREQKSTGAAPVTKEERVLRDALDEVMQASGLDVIGSEEGQNVLDEANGEAKLSAASHHSEEAERRNKMWHDVDGANAMVSGNTEEQERMARKERLRKVAEQRKELYEKVLSGEFDDVTLQLINDYIDNVTPYNEYYRPLSKRLPSEVGRGMRKGERTSAVDALFSRICESAVPKNGRVGPEGKRRIEEKKRELLKAWAIATGNWHTSVTDFDVDETPIGKGKDSTVYLEKDGNHVVKVSKGKDHLKKHRPDVDVDAVALFNHVFPNSRYEILGYGEVDGKFVKFLRQPFVDFANSTPLPVDERVEYMEKLGFKPRNEEQTLFSNGEIVVSDLQGSNIVRDASGNIRVIDADVKLHTRDIGGTYTYPDVETDTKTDGEVKEQKVRYFRTNDGEAYGFTVGGKIYFDPKIATSETLVHEYAHLWASALRAANPKEWKNVVALMKGTSVWNEVKKLYPELKTDDEIADEVIAQYSGRRGAERLREEAKRIAEGNGGVFEKAEAVSALNNVRQALQKFWKGVCDFLHIHYTNAEEVADRVMRDLLDGVDPRKFGKTDGKLREQENAEMKDIVARAKADGTYMKAPNGKPSNLSPRQWVQVRTKAFKKWFGDWEKASKWLKIKSMKAMQIENRTVSEEEAREAYERIGSVENAIDGKKVDFVKTSFGKILRHKGVDTKIIMDKLDVLFKESVPLFFEEETAKEGHKDHSSNFVGYHHYLNKITIDGKDYYVRFTAQEIRTNPTKKKADGFTPYQFHNTSISDVDIYESTESSVESPGTFPVTGTNRAYVDAKLANYLESAKESYENSSKIVDENGEPRVVYHQTNSTVWINRKTGENYEDLNWNEKDYWQNEASQEEWEETWEELDFYTFDNKNHGRRSVEMPAFFFAPEYDENHEYGDRTIEAFLNIKNPVINPTIENAGVYNDAGEKAMQKLIDEGYDGFIREYDGTINEINAFFPNQIKSATDNIGTFDADNNDIRFQFVGEKGAEAADHAEEVTTRLDNLAVAREMEEAKKDAKAIKMATGWERGADKKWRYEIPDVDFAPLGNAGLNHRIESQPWGKEYVVLTDRMFNGETLSESEMKRFDELSEKAEEVKRLYESLDVKYLDDYARSEELFKAYPELKQVKVVFVNKESSVGGSYSDETNTIYVNENSSLPYDEVFAHEIQHAIQYIEGFEHGGSPEMFHDPSEEDRRIVQFDKLVREKFGKADEETLFGILDGTTDEYRDFVSSLGEDYSRILKSLRATKKYAAKDFMRYYDRDVEENSKPSAYDQYQSLSGEVESRNVQKRMGMTPEERRASLASETEDVAREDQIFLFGEGYESRSELPSEELHERVRAYDESNDTELGRFVDYIERGRVLNDGEKPHFKVGKAGDVLSRYGIKGNIYASTETENERRHTRNTDHRLTPSEWVEAMESVNNPLAITRYKGFSNRYRVYTHAVKNGKSICLGMDVNDTGNAVEISNVEEFTDIRTAFGRDIEHAISHEDILYPEGPNTTETIRQNFAQSSAAHNSQLYEQNSVSAAKVGTNSETAKENSENLDEGGEGSFSARLGDAIAETEVNPSEAQKASGNYKKGHVKFGGYDYTIENPKGSVRSGKNASGKEWKTTMHDTYGYICGTFGKDGDHLDMFINDAADLDNWNGNVYVVDQVNTDGSFDEHKVMYGYGSEAGAREAYLANYSKGWKGLGNITGVSKDTFDKWLESSGRKMKPFAEYKEIAKSKESESIEEVNARFNERLQSLAENPNQKNRTLSLGRTSEFLKKGKIADAEIILEYDKLVRKSNESYENNHPFNVEDIRDLPRAIHAPIAVFENTNGKDSGSVILTELKKDGHNFIVVVKAQQQHRKGGVVLDVNEITTLFPKDARGIIHWFNLKKATNVGKEKALHFIEALRNHRETTITSKELDSAAKLVEDFGTTKENGENLSEGDGLLFRDTDVNEENDPDLRYSLREAPMRKWMSAATKKVERIAKKLGLKVKVMDSLDGLTGKKANAKGWFDPKTGEIVIVLPNHSGTADVVKTVLHEGVAHYGLRKMFGEDFNKFLENVYRNADEGIRRQIAEMAKRHGWDFRVATEEYLAGLAEDTDFEGKRNWLQKIKDLFLDMLRKAGVKLDGSLSDNDLRYILWQSYENLSDEHGIVKAAHSELMKQELGVGNYEKAAEDEAAEKAKREPKGDGLLYRDGSAMDERDKAIVRDRYDRLIESSTYQFREAVQDSMLSLRRLMEMIVKATGGVIADFENAYMAENALSSKNHAEQELYGKMLFKPLLNAVHDLVKQGSSREEVTRYMMAKHGLERNEVMARRAAQQKAREKFGEELSKAEAAVNADPLDQKAIDNLDDVKQRMADFEQAQYEKNRMRDYGGITGLMEIDDLAVAENDAQAFVDAFEKRYNTDELWARTNTCTKATLKKTYESGLLSRSLYQEIDDMYEYYIPLRGFDATTSDEVYAYLTHDSSGGFSPALKKAKGRKSVADDPLATIANMADSAIVQGNRNMMKQKFLKFAMNHPSDAVSVNKLWLKYNDITGQWEAVTAKIDDNDSADEVLQKTEQFEEQMEQLAKNDPLHYKKGKDAVDIPYVVLKENLNEHQVHVKMGGKDYVITINGNPRVAQALNGLTNPNNNDTNAIGKLIDNTAGWVNRQMSAFYTTRNPEFVLSNFLRDAMYANSTMWVRENPNYAIKFNKNFVKCNPGTLFRLLQKYNSGTLDMNDKMEEMFYQFMMNGGETGYTVVKDIEKQKKLIKKYMKGKAGQIPVAVAWDLVGDKLDEINRSVENCARFAAFITSRQMGRTIERSVMDAKEVSVNFNKKGAGSAMMGKTGQSLLGNIAGFLSGAGRSGYVFWNAAIQGATNFARLHKHHTAKAITYDATLFLLGALMGGYGGDDEDYLNLPEYVRRSSLCFKIPFTHTFLCIPLGQEMQAIYGLGELAANVMLGRERYTKQELMEAIAGQLSKFAPIDLFEGEGGLSAFIPSAVKPIVEAYFINKDWTGRPVYKDNDWNKLDPEWTKANKKTAQWLVDFSKACNEATGGDDIRRGWLNFNPSKIEHLFEGTFGGYVTAVNKLGKMAQTAAGEQEFDWRNMLMASRVLKSGDENAKARRTNSEYWKYYYEYTEVKRWVDHYENQEADDVEGAAEKAQEVYESPEYGRYEIVDEYCGEINDLSKEQEETTDAEELKELDAEIKMLKQEMVDSIHAYEDALKAAKRNK